MKFLLYNFQTISTQDFRASPLLSFFYFSLNYVAKLFAYFFVYIIMTISLITFDLKSKYGCLEISIFSAYFKDLFYAHSGKAAKNKF